MPVAMPFIKVRGHKYLMRPICRACNQRPVAVNYRRKDTVYYRKMCDNCIRRGRQEKAPVARWQSAGYKKKTVCDRCGFRSRYAGQLLVCHMDGRLTNTELSNLRTVCLNCTEEVRRLDVPWRPGDLQADH
jgi:hypothetical protein